MILTFEDRVDKIKLMVIEHIDEGKLKEDIKRIVFKYLDPAKYRAFFFGSRVKEDNFERADIDVGVEGENSIDIKQKIKIEEELNKLPILYKIDFVDFAQVTPKFRKIAGKYKEYIN